LTLLRTVTSMGESMSLVTALNGIEAIFAALAAIFWLKSALVPTPAQIPLSAPLAPSVPGGAVSEFIGENAPERTGRYEGNVAAPELEKLSKALRRQSRFSQWGAACASGAAALQGVVSIFSP
jgi:hypothetical protein